MRMPLLPIRLWTIGSDGASGYEDGGQIVFFDNR